MVELFIENKDFILILTLGLVFTFIGFYHNYKVDTLRKNGIKTNAYIVDYVSEVSYSHNKIQVYYHALINFTDLKGNSRQVKDEFGTSTKPNKKLPYPIQIAYLEVNDRLEVTTFNKIQDFFLMLIMTAGVIITIAVLFFRFFL